MGNCFGDSGSAGFHRVPDEEPADSGSRGPPPPYQVSPPVYSSSDGRPGGSSRTSTSSRRHHHHQQPHADHHGTPRISEEEQLKLAQRMALIHHLPTGVYDGSKKAKECAICMLDFDLGDVIRFLPCMHVYHQECVDDWLMRSFICPSCMEPVDAALLSSFGSMQ